MNQNVKLESPANLPLDLEEQSRVAELRKAIRHARAALDGGYYKKAVYVTWANLQTLGTTAVEAEVGNILASIATSHSSIFESPQVRKSARKKFTDALDLMADAIGVPRR